MAKEKTGKQSGSLEVYGYNADGDALPLEYLMRVTSIRNRAVVQCPIQDDVLLNVESNWVPLIPVSLLSDWNVYTQAATQGRKSVISQATSRRIWAGSSPISMSLRMRFEAVENTQREVLDPCRILMSMALPKTSSANEEEVESDNQFGYVQRIASKLDQLPFLSPPGPTPFSLEGILDLKGGRLEKVGSLLDAKGGDLIMVEIGNFVSFYNVIVRSASCSTPVKFDNLGNPISATVNLTFETYEMMTVEGLAEVFSKTKLYSEDGNETNQLLQ